MAILVKETDKGLPEVLAAGSPGECLKAGKEHDAKGGSILTVWDTRKGIIWTGKGIVTQKAKDIAAALEKQARPRELANAEAVLAKESVKARNAKADLARAQERLEAAEAAEAKARAAAEAVTPKKKAAKKKAAPAKAS